MRVLYFIILTAILAQTIIKINNDFLNDINRSLFFSIYRILPKYGIHLKLLKNLSTDCQFYTQVTDQKVIFSLHHKDYENTFFSLNFEISNVDDKIQIDLKDMYIQENEETNLHSLCFIKVLIQMIVNELIRDESQRLFSYDPDSDDVFIKLIKKTEDNSLEFWLINHTHRMEFPIKQKKQQGFQVFIQKDRLLQFIKTKDFKKHTIKVDWDEFKASFKKLPKAFRGNKLEFVILEVEITDPVLLFTTRQMAFQYNSNMTVYHSDTTKQPLLKMQVWIQHKFEIISIGSTPSKQDFKIKLNFSPSVSTINSMYYYNLKNDTADQDDDIFDQFGEYISETMVNHLNQNMSEIYHGNFSNIVASNFNECSFEHLQKSVLVSCKVNDTPPDELYYMLSYREDQGFINAKDFRLDEKYSQMQKKYNQLSNEANCVKDEPYNPDVNQLDENEDFYQDDFAYYYTNQDESETNEMYEDL